MKSILGVFLLVLITTSLSAQVISTDSVIRQSQGGADSMATVLVKVPVTNLTADSQRVDWRRLVNSYDSTWTGTLICDLNNCYPAATSANPPTYPSVIPPNSTKYFSVTFNNNNNTGSGHVQLEMYVTGGGTPDTVVSDIYLALSNTTAIKTVNSEGVSIYPNPASDYVMIQYKESTPLNRVEIYSMLGRKVLAQKINSNESLNKIDLSEMPKGLYMVRVFDESNNVVLTKSISHIR